MLWDLIFEFFVKYIFGGNIDYTHYGGLLGTTYLLDYDGSFDLTNSQLLLKLGQYFIDNNEFFGVDTLYIPLGNYLSFIATIITMVVILLVIGHFIKKTFNLFGRII